MMYRAAHYSPIFVLGAMIAPGKCMSPWIPISCARRLGFPSKVTTSGEYGLYILQSVSCTGHMLLPQVCMAVLIFSWCIEF